MTAEKEKKVRQIVVNYAALMIECAMNPDFQKEFMSNPVKILREQVGLTFPKHSEDYVKVIIDLENQASDRLDNNFRWPIIWVFFKGPVKVQYKEDGQSKEQDVDAIRFNEALDVKEKLGRMTPIIKLQEAEILKNDTIPSEVIDLVTENGVGLPIGYYVSPKKRHDGNHDLPIPMKDCFTVIILPFVDVKSDPLSDYNFLDGDIVLSPCT
jgi:hypothetical protein